MGVDPKSLFQKSISALPPLNTLLAEVLWTHQIAFILESWVDNKVEHYFGFLKLCLKIIICTVDFFYIVACYAKLHDHKLKSNLQ